MKTLYAAMLMLGSVAFAAGSLDLKFGTNGKVVVPGKSYSAYLTTDGWGVYAATEEVNQGLREFHLYHINYEGKLDTSFGQSGLVTIKKDSSSQFSNIKDSWIGNLYVSRNGLKLWLEDNHASFMLDLTHWGALSPKQLFLPRADDFSMNEDGTFVGSIAERALELHAFQGDGNYLNSFGHDGLMIHSGVSGDFSTQHKIDGNRTRIAVTTYEENNSSIELVQVDNRGLFDLSFGNFGRIKYHFDPNELTYRTIVDPKGPTYIMTGLGGCRGNMKKCRDVNDYRIWRLNETGRIDSEFGTRGFIWVNQLVKDSEYVPAMLVDDQGYLVVLLQAESKGASLIRMNRSGQLDSQWGTAGRLDVTSGAQYLFQVNDQKYLLSGQTGAGRWFERYESR